MTRGHCPHIRPVPDFCSPLYTRGHHQTRRVTSHMTLQNSSIGCHIRNYRSLLRVVSTGGHVNWGSCQLGVMSTGGHVNWGSCQLGVMSTGGHVNWGSCRRPLPNKYRAQTTQVFTSHNTASGQHIETRVFFLKKVVMISPTSHMLPPGVQQGSVGCFRFRFVTSRLCINMTT